MRSIRTLLSGSIDYAGLFPPAKLEMASAVRNYADYRAGEHAWALGRFVVPATRLDVFERAAESLLPAAGSEPWRLTAIGGSNLAGDLAAALDFNQRHGDGGAGAAVVDTIEIRADSGEEIERAMAAIGGRFIPYFEIPIASDPGHLVAAIARAGARAKVRTGGVTPADFPAPANLLKFLRLCVGAGVPFKATAGLHHPLRATHPISEEPGCESATMYGFFNVFLTAAFLRAGIPAAEAPRVLEEGELAAFSFDDDGVTWRGRRLDNATLEDVRRRVALAFGSCSFLGPIEELKALALL